MTSASRLITYNPNDVKPGWIAFFLVLALLIATFLLWRSMNTQLGRIRVPKATGTSEPGTTVESSRTDTDVSEPDTGAPHTDEAGSSDAGESPPPPSPDPPHASP